MRTLAEICSAEEYATLLPYSVVSQSPQEASVSSVVVRWTKSGSSVAAADRAVPVGSRVAPPGDERRAGTHNRRNERRPTRLGVGRVAPGASGRGTAALDVDSGRALTAAGRESKVCSCGDAGSPSVAQAIFYRDTAEPGRSLWPLGCYSYGLYDPMVPAAVSV